MTDMTDNTCIKCSTTKIIKDLKKIEKGSHLVFPRCVITPCKEPIYYHHAIVVEVVPKPDEVEAAKLEVCPKPDEFEVSELEVILKPDEVEVSELEACPKPDKVDVRVAEFDTSGCMPLKPAVKINRKPIDLEDGVYLVEYKKSYNRENAAKLAEDIADNTSTTKNTYSIFNNNCEHFVTECITGVSYSKQVGEYCACFNGFVCSSFLSLIFISILLFETVLDGVLRFTSTEDVFFGFMFIPPVLYMVPTLLKFSNLKKLEGKGLCPTCYNRELYILFVPVFLFFIFTIIEGLTVWLSKLSPVTETFISLVISLFGITLIVFSQDIILCCFKLK